MYRCYQVFEFQLNWYAVNFLTLAISSIASVDGPEVEDVDACVITVSYTHLTLPTIYSV